MPRDRMQFNVDIAREHLEAPAAFEPTPKWDVETAWDQTRS